MDFPRLELVGRLLAFPLATPKLVNTPRIGRLSLSASMLVLWAYGWRMVSLDHQSLWRDEVDAIRFSSGPLLELLQDLIRKGHNGPLYFMLLKVWRSLAGDSEFVLRYISLLAGVLMVALVYRVGRTVRLGERRALIAALLTATSPYLTWYSQEAKMYTWLACLILVAVYAYHQALSGTGGGRWWTLFVVVTSLSFYTHILAPLMLAVYGLWGVIRWSQLRQRWRGWLLSMALLTIPYLPLAGWQVSLLLEEFQSGHAFYPFDEQFLLLWHVYSAGLLRSEFVLYARYVGLLLLLAGLLLGGRSIDRRRWPRLVLALWLFVPPLLVYLISLRVTVFEDRYLIYILPAYYLLLALGVAAITDRLPWLGAGLLALVLVFNSWAGWRQATLTIKADFRGAANYIAQVGQSYPAVMIQMPYLRHTFDYYFPRDYYHLDGLWTNDGRDPAEVDARMREIVAGLPGLWLVVSEEGQWDERRLVWQWLETHGERVDQAHFVRVMVYRYSFE